MRRDADHIRQLLFEFEASDDWRFLDAETLDASAEEEKRTYHVKLMCDQGLLVPISGSTFRMTSYGHDFLDATRNDEIWEKTKRAASQAGGFTLNLLKDIAVEYVKMKARAVVGEF